MWKTIPAEWDSGWEEYHKMVTSPRFGRVKLKVWMSAGGFYRAAVVEKQGDRHLVSLAAETPEDAKQEAEGWVLGEDV